MNTSLDSVSSFLAVASTLSFTEAARRLGVSQPSVSRHVRELENLLGSQLISRDRRRVALTTKGRELRARLAPLLAGVSSALDEAAADARAEGGVISFGCLSEIGQHLFTKLLIEFQEKHPAVDLKVRFLGESEIVERIREGTLDFGVTSVVRVREGLRFYPLLSERIVLVTRSQNGAPPRAGESRFVAFGERDALLEPFLRTAGRKSSGAGRGVRASRVSTVNSHRAMIEILLHRDSYAALPYFSVKEWVRSGKLRIVAERPVRNPLYLVHLENDHMHRRSLAFRDFLRDRCRRAELE